MLDPSTRRNAPPVTTLARHRHGSPSRGSGGPRVAAEQVGEYASVTGEVVAKQLLTVLDGVQGRPVDTMAEAEIRAELRALEEASRRVDARKARLAAEVARRRAEQARKERPNSPRADAQARREAQRELEEEFDWTPSQAKNAMQLGAGLAEDSEEGRAFDDGRLSPRHAAKLRETLTYLADYFHAHPEQREPITKQILDAAASMNAVQFARYCRRLLAEIDHDAAMRQMERSHGRRYARMTDTEDGMTVLSAQWAGADALIIKTAFKNFTRPDAHDEHRTPEQRAADAFVAVAQAALEAGGGSRKARPHVMVRLDWQTILGDAGVAETLEGPLPYGEIRRMLADCGVSRLLTDPNGIATESGELVRNVPMGLWRQIVDRDGGCIEELCDMPVTWCQTMHLVEPFREGGRLTRENAGLGCSYHHKQFDAGRLELYWVGERPFLRRPREPDDPGPPG